MHIGMLYSTAFPPEEGIGFYVHKLSRELDNRGHEVTLITRGGMSSEFDQREGITIVKAPFFPLYPFHVDVHGVFVDRMLKRMDDDLDVIHVHSPLAPRINTSVPVVLTVHTTAVEDAKHKENLTPSVVLGKLTTRVSSQRIIAGQIRNAVRVTTVSASVKQKLDEHYGVDNALVIGNGVDTNVFHPADGGNDEPFVFNVSGLKKGKGLSDLIKCMSLLTSSDEDVPLLKIAGEGPLESSLKSQARKAGIRDKVTFLNFCPQDELVPLYQRATVFVHPSRHEGLPTVLLEAMACGCPVIATNISGSSEVVNDGDNGVLVPPGQPAAMADAISSLLHDPERREEFGMKARQTIEEQFRWRTIVGEFEDLYHQVIGHT